MSKRLIRRIDNDISIVVKGKSSFENAIWAHASSKRKPTVVASTKTSASITPVLIKQSYRPGTLGCTYFLAFLVMESAVFPVHYRGKEYDIQRFLRDHPGGVNTLAKFKDKSITEVMSVYGHSNSAYHILNDFKLDSDVNLTGKVSENGRILTKDESSRKEEEIALLEELEARLDWSAPLIHQIDAIAPHYETWVNSAVYRRCRLFGNPLLESMTFTPWYVVPLFWIPIIVYLVTTQFKEHVGCGDSCTKDSLTFAQFSRHIAAGIMLWTVVEYTLHRWIFHLNPGSSVTMMKVHFLIHGLHHKMPFDGLRQVFPPIPAVMLATIIYQPIQLVLSYPVVKLAGGLMGYLTYDLIHYYVHHGSPQDGSYLYAMKRYHSNHHFINHDQAFGITSKIWDQVFKTYVKVKKLGFSLHW